MSKSLSSYGFDGTTGKSNYGGRRTHIIQLLRDSGEPLTVSDVAESAGVHVNTARFHLESLVDSGLAERRQEPRSTPGRPKVLYVGILPNQTHERAQGYRILAETLTLALTSLLPEPPFDLQELGMSWGRELATLETDLPTSRGNALSLAAAKMDALWFAPEIITQTSNGKFVGMRGDTVSEMPSWNYQMKEGQEAIVLHHLPFTRVTATSPESVGALYVGFMNGLLEALRSDLRVTSIFMSKTDFQLIAPTQRVDVESWTPDLSVQFL